MIRKISIDVGKKLIALHHSDLSQRKDDIATYLEVPKETVLSQFETVHDCTGYYYTFNSQLVFLISVSSQRVRGQT